MSVAELRTYPIERLHDFTKRVFESFGVPRDDARLAADVLGTSDLRGIDSHGVARLRCYVDMLALGRINPRPSPCIVRETPSTATFDGDNGLGLVVGPKANALAMEKAVAVGSGWVSVRNSNHFGIAGYYPLQALKCDLIGWAMTNSTKLVCRCGVRNGCSAPTQLQSLFPGCMSHPLSSIWQPAPRHTEKSRLPSGAARTFPQAWPSTATAFLPYNLTK